MTPPALDFAEHVVLVTGAASGIGLGIARAFHAAGARVALADMRAEPLRRAVAELGGGPRLLAHVADVRDAEAVGKLVETVERALGPLTVAIANAGIYPNTPVLELTVEEWDRVMETNVRGVFLTCQAAARRLVARGAPGRIVTIASGAASSGRVGAAHYCASKAAVVMFTKVLALELAARSITVNCIAPGFVEVQSEVSPLSAEYVRALRGQIPLGRSGTPADIAGVALFLCSPLADYMTGEVVAVNGGAAAGRAFLPPSRPAPSA